MKKLLNKELVIGACVIVALAILFFGIDYLKGINIFKPANFYCVYYDNVAGLEVASPVTVNGYKVGQVREINFPFDKPGKIEVLLAVDRKLHIPDDSKAVIASSLLSGGSVEIMMGSSKKFLEVGSAIEPSDNADLMATLKSEVLPSVTALVPKVDSLLTSLNVLASDPALLQSIRRLDLITSDIALTTKGLNYQVNNSLPVIMGNASRITYNIDTITSNLNDLSLQLKMLPLQATMANVDEVTRNLVNFSNQLNDKNSTLGMLMNDPELYEQLNRVSADIDSLIVDIKRNPKRYISIKLL